MLRGIFTLIAGRWQIPAVLLAIGMVAYAALRMRPAPPVVDFEALRADLLALHQAGAFRDAADATANLLEMDPPLPAAQRAELHELLATIVFDQESLRRPPDPRNVELILEHQELAKSLGRPSRAESLLRVAQAQEWLQRAREATQTYRDVLQRQPAPDQRRAALHALIRLLDGRNWAEEERRGFFEQLINDPGVRSSYLWWGVQHAMQEAFDRGQPQEAHEFLDRIAPQFQRSDLAGYYDYLTAWLHVEMGQFDQAEPVVVAVQEWLSEREGVDPEMAACGFLPALLRVLAGRIHLADHRPQSALEQFEEAAELEQNGGTYASATFGQCEALAALERHAAARERLRQAMPRILSYRAGAAGGIPRLQRVMQRLFDARMALGDYDNAIAYLTIALQVTPEDDQAERRDLHASLANAAALAADERTRGGASAEEAAPLHRLAAGHYESAMALATADPGRAADLMWDAARHYDAAGDSGDARRILKLFVETLSSDARLPRALLQIGESFAIEADHDSAMQWYGLVVKRYPSTEEAARAQLRTAECLLELPAARHAEAEQMLIALLESDRLTPTAPVYREALLRLAQHYYNTGRFAAAANRLESFLSLYEDDPQRVYVRFELADAYRRSGLALRETPPADANAQAVADESRRRFRAAADRFEALIAETTGVSERDDPLGATYARLALMYRGDCLYALNESETLREALATYRQAAARYPAETVALAAQVQIANVHLRMGRVVEAARAVETARWMLRSMPDRAFRQAPLGEDRETWERYLTAVAGAHLFRDVLAEGKQ